MKWKKLGKIFDPAKFDLPFGCFGCSQAPQALVFDNFVRIYFSLRKADNDGLLSHIVYIDMDKSFSSIINMSKETVLPLGETGCFDEHGIFHMNVLRHNDQIYGYYSGLNRCASVAIDSAIGLAVSNDDGKTFQKFGKGPVLAQSVYEPFLIATPFVKIINGQFHMWYIFGTNWTVYEGGTKPERMYKIGHAVSEDGVTWAKDNRQIICDRIPYECQALPTVIDINDRYHMLFGYRCAYDFRTNSEKSYRLGHAYSDDMINWTRDDASVGIDVSEDSWDSDMMLYPHVFRCDNKIYLMYNGNEFGKYGFGLAILEDI